ncbi:MAG: hypothetical protein K6D94_03320 [Clostridiales bacterium]|nr:hypothetical protein [Clostridiales bacterium]
MMRKTIAPLLLLAAIAVHASFLPGCAAIDRLEEIGAGYEDMEERIYSLPLNSAARRLMSALSAGDLPTAASMIRESDGESVSRLSDMLGGECSYRLREEERTNGVTVCLMRTVGGSSAVRMRLLFDPDDSAVPFLAVEAAYEDDYLSPGFFFSAGAGARGVSFPSPDGEAGIPEIPSLDRENCPEDWRGYDSYHEAAAAYMQAVWDRLSSGGEEIRSLFSVQTNRTAGSDEIDGLISLFGEGWSSWRTDGSLVTASGAVCDEYDENGVRQLSEESDAREHIRAVFKAVYGSGDMTVSLSIWVKDDPEPYRVGLEGVKLEFGGETASVGRGV